MRWKFRAVLLWMSLTMVGGMDAVEPYKPVAGNIFKESWRWTELDVLSPYVVRQAAKAPDGKLWFAVHGGVVAYDGFTVTPYLYEDAGWAENNTVAIFVASNGIVYFVTKEFGACLEDGEWTRLFDIKNEAFAYSSNSRIAEADDGSVWMASRSGLFRVTGKRAQKVDLDTNSFSSLKIDQLNRLWLSEITRREILRFDLDVQTGLPGEEPFRIETQGVLGKDFIVEFTEGATGSMWVSSNSDLNALRKVEGDDVEDVLGSWTGFGPSVNRYTVHHQDETLWVITQALIAEYKQGEWVFHDMGEFATWFSFVYQLDGDTLLLGGHTDKTYRFDASGERFEAFQNLNFQCRDLSGNWWFITKEKKIVRYNGDEDEWISFDRADGVIDVPSRFFIDADGVLWVVGSHDGVAAVSRYLEGSWVKELHPGFASYISPFSIFEGVDGILYMGGEQLGSNGNGNFGGLLKYWRQNGSWAYSVTVPPEVPRRVLQIAQTEDQTLWISSGASLWSKQGNQPAVAVEGFEGNWIDNLSVDQNGNLWVLAWRTGISTLQEGVWRKVTVPEYRTSNQLAFLHADRNSDGIWLATNQGLSRFDGSSWSPHVRLPELNLKRDENQLVVANYGSLWINRRGEDWLDRDMEESAGRNDQSFHTVHYKPGQTPPETRLVAFDESIIESGNALIQWEGQDAWSQTWGDDLQYSYRVNEGQWSAFSSERQALLQNLSSGNYRVEVRARDLDWNVDPTPAFAEFSVTPFLWKRPWFVGSVVLAIITILVLAYLLIRMRVRHLIAIEEFKIDFFTNISHELRTPLSAIVGPIESMLKRKSAEPLKDSLTMVQRNARRMVGLVNQLLEFRKVELGMLRYEPVRSDLILFLKDVVFAHVNLWERKNQKFELKAAPEHLICGFDPDKLQHITSNLISNAIKYTPEHGQISVQVNVLEKRSDQLGESHSWLSLTVRDSGIGIEPGRHELIFKPFYRERDHDKDYEGTGIGLAYTYELVQLWGGEIKVESPVDHERGTRFIVTLPLQSGDGLKGMVDSFVADSGENHEDEEIESKTSILVVEDNADISNFLRSELVEDYEVYTAENGEQALEVVGRVHPNLVVTDLMMPVMDGLELCKRIKTSSESSHIPVLMLTARSSDEFRIKGIEHGADDYFSKPVNIELLKARIKSVLETRRMLRERFTRQILIQPEEITVTPLDEQFLRKAVKVVQEHMRDEDFDVVSFSRKMAMGRASLYRKMNAVVGEPPFKFIRSIRLKRAAQLLESGNYNVSRTMEEVGINGLSHFGKIFKDEFGCTPSEYRERHEKKVQAVPESLDERM